METEKEFILKNEDGEVGQSQDWQSGQSDTPRADNGAEQPKSQSQPEFVQFQTPQQTGAFHQPTQPRYVQEDPEDAIKELQALAGAEAEQWDYMPKPPRRLRKRDHLFLKVFLTLFVLFSAMFCISAHLVFGKGWINRIIHPETEKKGFTLPVAEYPELDDKFYQSDGRYTVEGVYEAVSPSIVTIEAYTDKSPIAAYGQGSGIIMSEDGYIITNSHVVELATLAIKVRIKDGTEYSATVVGSDPKSDIAVLKIAAKDLPAAQFGDSDKITIGEQVVAIGSPAGLEGSVTTGIASGVDRMIKVEETNISMSCIQIDAAINPGNSGGALVNMWGQVVGITSSKLDALEYDNIGFAIEMSAAQPIIEELIENGAVLGRPRIGISFYEVSDAYAEINGTPAGLQIVEISPDCDIANTELKVGDYITEMNGQEVRSSDDVYEIILKMSPGDTVTAKVTRVLPSGKLDEFEISFKLMQDTSFIDEEETENVDEPEEDEAGE